MVAFKNKILVKVLKVRMILQCTVDRWAETKMKINIYMNVLAVKSQITCNNYEINTDIYINYWYIHVHTCLVLENCILMIIFCHLI